MRRNSTGVWGYNTPTKKMIINTGARTDTVQYFSEWLLNRFEEGYVYTRNPLFPHKVTRYELSPDKVDAVLFCSKNYAPILPRLREITDKYRTYFHYTITAYLRLVGTARRNNPAALSHDAAECAGDHHAAE